MFHIGDVHQSFFSRSTVAIRISADVFVEDDVACAVAFLYAMNVMQVIGVVRFDGCVFESAFDGDDAFFGDGVDCFCGSSVCPVGC